jgi:hypothetical protein
MIFTIPVLIFQMGIAFSFWTVFKTSSSIQPIQKTGSTGKQGIDNTCNFLLLAVFFGWNVESFFMITWSLFLLWLQLANIGFWYGLFLFRNIDRQVSCIPNKTDEQRENTKYAQLGLWLLISSATWMPLMWMYGWAAVFWLFPQPFGFILGAGLSDTDS